jgi:hypothetical protein
MAVDEAIVNSIVGNRHPDRMRRHVVRKGSRPTSFKRVLRRYQRYGRTCRVDCRSADPGLLAECDLQPRRNVDGQLPKRMRVLRRGCKVEIHR